MIARDVMRRYVVTANESDKVGDVAAKLTKHRISGLPVVNSSEELVGMISESDIIKRFTFMLAESSGKKYLTSLAHSLDLLAMLCEEDQGTGEKVYDRLRRARVSEVMTREIVAARAEDTIQRIAQLMTQKKVNRIPITDGGKLIGIVGRADIVKRVPSMGMTVTPKV